MLSFKKHYFALWCEYGTKRCSSCSRAVFKNRFFFYLLETDHLWCFNPLLNKQKLKGKFLDNLGQNVQRLFHLLAQLVFTASETDVDYYHQKVNLRVASRVVERLETQGLMKLVNFKRIPEMLGFDDKYIGLHPKAKL